MRYIIIIAYTMLALTACQNKNTEQVFVGEAQGTSYTIKYIGEKNLAYPKAIDSLLAAIDTSMSTYIDVSTISKLNRSDSAVIDEMFIDVFKLSQKINKESNGAFDPTLAPVIAAWGFDFEAPQSMDSGKVDSLMAFCGFDMFTLKDSVLKKEKKEAKLNFNAVAQGYSVDLMADLLHDKFGIENYYVELGGELIVRGRNKNGNPWRIGVDKPQGKNLEHQLSAIVNLEDKAMVTSGNYRKYIEKDGRKYSHSINPIDGFPVAHNLLSATIIASDAGTADAVATACMVIGLEKSKAYLNAHPNYEGILIYADTSGAFNTYYTPELEGKIETLD